MKLFRIVLLTTILVLLLLPLTPILAGDKKPIDIGTPAEDRASQGGSGSTLIAYDNPANLDGLITSINIWLNTNATAVVVGTFSANGSNFTCRSSQILIDVPAGNQTYSVSLTVKAGDYLGCYLASGSMEQTSGLGGGNFYIFSGSNKAVPGTVADYTLITRAISLYGTGLTTDISREDYTGLNPIRKVGPGIILLGFILTCGFFGIMAIRKQDKIEVSISIFIILMLIGIALLVGMPILIQGFDAIMWGW